MGRGEVLEVHFAFIRRATEFKISSERAAKQDPCAFMGDLFLITSIMQL